MDALQSFTFLTSNLPAWILKIDDLHVQAFNRRSEFRELAHEAISLARGTKDSSIESLRPEHTAEPDRSVVVAIQAADQPSKVRLATVCRKRKPVSIISGNSGRRKYRNRSTIVVYYDSAIQDGFDMMVRNIGSARNNLRKGKTTATFKSRMASMALDDDSSTSAGGFAMLNPKMMQPRFTRNRDGHPRAGGNGLEGFDRADKELEAAQKLCELGAHQFLRDGDCIDEILGAKQRLENSLGVAEGEVVRLQNEEAEEKEREEQVSKGGDCQSQTTTVAKPEPRPPKHLELSGTYGAIEVDDNSDQASLEIDLTAFRSTRRVY
ncbi:hypothetical protein MMC06_004826 [Schaereria dolodes]|nr:hypothetical protein [Schaereria dolodes]